MRLIVLAALLGAHIATCNPGDVPAAAPGATGAANPAPNKANPFAQKFKNYMAEKLIDGYVSAYSNRYQSVKEQTELATRELTALIERTPGFIVPPEISSRTKAPESLRGKLLKKLGQGKINPNSDDEVDHEAWDLIGMRITTFAPSVELDIVEGLLNQSFIMSKWKRGDPNSEYPGNNYRGTHGGVAIEIQTRGSLDHSLLQLQHKVRFCMHIPRHHYRMWWFYHITACL